MALPWRPVWPPPNLSGARILGIDTETHDPGLVGKRKDRLGPAWGWSNGSPEAGFICGYCIAAPGASWYFPVRHAGGGNLDVDQVERFIRDTVSVQRTYVFHSAEYDVGWCKVHGIDFHPNADLRDTARGAALLDERVGAYSLDACCARAGIPGKDESGLDPACVRAGIELPDHTRTKSAKKRAELLAAHADKVKQSLWLLPAQDVAPYAMRDPAATLELFEWQAPQIVAEGLTRVYDLECELIPGLVAMRRRGIRVDLDGAERLWEELRAMEAGYQADIRKRFGVLIEGPKHAESIARACDRLGITYGRTAKKEAPSFPDLFLKRHPHPAMQVLKAWRHAATVRSLNVEGGLLKHSHSSSDGPRIHPEWKALSQDDGGAVTGRVIAARPNVTQMSGRTLLGSRVRSLVLPEVGTQWGRTDISQQEPRLIVHYACALKLTRAEEARAMFEQDKADWHSMVAELTELSRDDAKPVNLGSGYGQGKEKLAIVLDVDDETAAAIYDQYHERLPFIKELTSRAANMIQRRGYVRTYLGRRVRFNTWEPRAFKRGGPKYVALPLDEARAKWPGRELRRAYAYRGANGIIQGSGADWLKLGTRDLIRAGHLPMLLAHDEAGVPVLSTEDAAQVATILREAVSLRVRVVVDYGVGPNWRDAKAKK